MPVLAPFVNGLYRKRQVPTGGAGIDWTHPLTNGLIGCWLPGNSTGLNLVGSSPDLGFQPAPLATIGVTPEGPGLVTTGTSSGLGANAPSAFTTPTVFSLYWRGVIIGGQTNNGCLIGVSYDSVGSSPFGIYEIIQSNSNSNVFLLWNSGGTAGFGTASSMATNTVVSVGGSFTVNGNAILYTNGTQAQSNSFGASAPNTTATSQIHLATDSGAAGFTSNCTTIIACMWNRALSADEQLFLHLQPYDFLLAPEYEMSALSFASLPAISWEFPLITSEIVGY